MMKRYIDVAYKDRDTAKRLGARWDPSVKRWYCPPGSVLAKAYGWRKAPAGGMVTSANVAPSVSASVAANSNRVAPRANPQLSLLG